MARFHRETKKKQFEVCDRQTDIRTEGHPDRQTESIVDNNTPSPRLGAEINRM